MLKLTTTSFIILLATSSFTNAAILKSTESTQPKINPIQSLEIALPSSTLFEPLSLDSNPTSSSIISTINDQQEQETNMKHSEEPLEIHEGSSLWGLLIIGILGGIQLLFSHLIITPYSIDITKCTH
jgi:hypothetical protein